MAGPDLGFLETVRCPSAVTIWKFQKSKDLLLSGSEKDRHVAKTWPSFTNIE